MAIIKVENNKPQIVFYHANCLDGFGAAYAAWENLGGVEDKSIDILSNQGAVLLTEIQNQIDYFKDKTFEFKLTITTQNDIKSEFELICCNAPGFIASELGNYLSSISNRYACIYHYDGKEKKWIYSLSSNESLPGCDRLAGLLYGGGHAHAAGFSKENNIFFNVNNDDTLVI